MILTIEHGNVLDAEAGEIVGERTVVVEDDRIVEVTDSVYRGTADVAIDAAGRFVLPGFIDAHVHVSITTMDLSRLHRLDEVERSLRMAAGAERTLQRGFTTVRDTGGDAHGLRRAIDAGWCDGPRVVAAGRFLSQTGGHGDMRPRDIATPTCGCEIVSSQLGHVADGVDAVRKAARHELRQGADFLKIMSSGGVASPADPFDSIQYTGDEIQAITVEARHRHTYVTSHAYQPEAIRLAVDHGVTCIEHGNLIDAATAEHLAGLDAVMVPTLVTYKAMQEVGAKFGLPEVNLQKNRGVFEHGQRAIEIARTAGVTLGFGTDLLGEAQDQQNDEFRIRADLEPAADVLRSMYVTNARLCHLEGEIGSVAPDAYADLLVCDADPLDRLADLAEPDAHLSCIIQSGRVVKNPAL